MPQTNPTPTPKPKTDAVTAAIQKALRVLAPLAEEERCRVVASLARLYPPPAGG